jgi:hypothetical protein
MPTAWDAALPATELGSEYGFAWSLPFPVQVQKMEDGTVKTARIVSAAPSDFVLPYRMTAAQFSTFKTWYAGVVAGDNQFTKTVISTAYTFIITAAPKVEVLGGGLNYNVAIPVQQVL